MTDKLFAVEKVSKLEAAKRQLRTSIWMHFQRADAVSVHTLASAAYQILFDLGAAKNLVSMVKGNPYIREERRREWVNILSTAQSFFKHADRDPDGELEFRSAMTPLHILDAVSLYAQLTGRLFPEANFFRIWFMLKYPELVADGPAKQTVDIGLAKGIDPDDYETILEVLHRQPRE